MLRRWAMVTVVGCLVLCACGGDGEVVGGADNESTVEYPDGQITFVNYVAPGSGPDFALNAWERELTNGGIVDVSMRVVSIEGGAGLTAIAAMATEHAGADDMLMIGTASPLTATLREPENIGLDELVPIAGVHAEPIFVFVPSESPYENLADVADALRDDPGAVVIGGGSIGSADTMAAAQLAKTLDLEFDDLTYVPLTGEETPANILGGHIDIGLKGPELLDFVEAGDMRVLGVASEERLSGERVAEIPTFVEEGYDVLQVNWRGMFGPPDMPDYAVQYWSDAFTQLVETESWAEIAGQNFWEPLGMNTEEFQNFIDNETESMEVSLADLGLL